jgi:hypothetical protein
MSNPLSTAIDQHFSKDTKRFGFGESDVQKFIVETCQNDTETSNEIKSAECLAFAFSENRGDKGNINEAFYCPMSIGTDIEGNKVESPSFAQVTPEMIDYWEIRGDEAPNPILKTRYLGLVWHLKKLKTNEKPDISAAQGFIDAIIEAANGDYYCHELCVYPKLEHALELSIKTKDTQRRDAIVLAIVDLEKRHAKDNLAETWGKSFDILFDKKGVALTTEQEQSLISDLELRVERLEAVKDTIGLKFCAERIAIYHRKHNRPDDVRAVLLRFGNFVIKQLEEDRKAYVECTVGEDGVKTLHMGKGSAFEHISALEDLLELYNEFNIHDFDDEILIQIRAREPEIHKFLIPISAEIPISQEKIDIDKAFAPFLTGTTEEIILRLICAFIPNRVKAEEQMKKSAKDNSFWNMIPNTYIDHTGRSVVKVGSIEDVPEARLITEISNRMTFKSEFLNMAMHKLHEEGKLSVEEVFQYVTASPTIDADRHGIIRLGLEAYFKRDFITAIHLLIPQIENAVRDVLARAGGNIYKPNRDGGYNSKLLEDLLREPIVKTALTEEIVEYFRILFTDSKGWNLRNNLCHGMLRNADFNFTNANRVIHALLCVGSLRPISE